MNVDGEVFSTRLANGIRILVLPTPSPMASCQVICKGGVLVESDETNGLCSLMSGLLPRSLGEERRTALAAYQEETAADYYSFCDESFVGISLTVRGRDLLAGLDFLAEMILRPSFTEEGLKEYRQQVTAFLAAPASAWTLPVRGHLKKVLYRRHPYRMLETGSAESLPEISLAAVEDCHTKLWTAGNMVVVVAGRVSSGKVCERLAELLAPVPAAASELPEWPAESAGRSAVTATFQHERRYGALALGFSGIPWSFRTWCALELIKSLLVGPENNSAAGRLFRAVRDEGTAYHCCCLNQAGFGEGYFAVLAAFSPAKQERLVRVIEAQIEKIRAGEIEAREIEHCRKLHLLSRYLLYESPRRQAYFEGRGILLADDLGYRDRFVEELHALAPVDLAMVAKRYFTKKTKGLVVLRPREARPRRV